MTQLVLNIENPSALRAIRALVKNMVGVTISKTQRVETSSYTLERAYGELKNGEVVGPFHSADDFMKDLLD